jgi:rhodanese-related sulfurtransferase
MTLKHFICVLATVSAAAELSSAQETISVEDFKAGVDNGSFDMILDVRTQSEWDSGHIPGAIHIPIDAFEDDDIWNPLVDGVSAFSCNKACATIVAHCAVGARATTAIEKLRAMGFEGTLYNGQGTRQWVQAGYELTLEDDVRDPICASTNICATTTAAGSTTTVDDTDDTSTPIDEEEATPSTESSTTMNGTDDTDGASTPEGTTAAEGSSTMIAADATDGTLTPIDEEKMPLESSANCMFRLSAALSIPALLAIL